MEFVKYRYSDVLGTGMDYYYEDASSLEIYILGNFLTTDVRSISSSFKDWFLDEMGISSSSNVTFLEKDNGNVLLYDLFPEEEHEGLNIKMTGEQFIKLLDDWDKIYKLKPKEVIIKHENGEFIIETKD